MTTFVVPFPDGEVVQVIQVKTWDFSGVPVEREVTDEDDLALEESLQ